MLNLFFQGYRGLFRVVVVGALAYIVLVVFLRVSGKRTLSKLNAFDLVVTVSLGSTLATILLSKDVALVEGTVGMALLIGMQFAVTWLGVRVGWLRRAVRGDPALLLFEGAILPQAIIKQRVTEGEVLAAIRGAGISKVEDVEAVVLETDGSLSVLPRVSAGKATALHDVENVATESRDR